MSQTGVSFDGSVSDITGSRPSESTPNTSSEQPLSATLRGYRHAAPAMVRASETRVNVSSHVSVASSRPSPECVPSSGYTVNIFPGVDTVCSSPISVKSSNGSDNQVREGQATTAQAAKMPGERPLHSVGATEGRNNTNDTGARDWHNLFHRDHTRVSSVFEPMLLQQPSQFNTHNVSPQPTTPTPMTTAPAPSQGVHAPGTTCLDATSGQVQHV